MDKRAYQEQAESNEAAASHVRDKYPDWAVTMCFYAAIHWVNCYEKREDTIVRNPSTTDTPHGRRRNYVYDLSQKLQNRELRKAYDFLYDESIQSRYMEGLQETAISKYRWSSSTLNRAFRSLEIIRDCLS